MYPTQNDGVVVETKCYSHRTKEKELSDIEQLTYQLTDSVAKENYILAAKLRDQIQKIKNEKEKKYTQKRKTKKS